MPSTYLVIILLSSLGWAIFDATRKNLSHHIGIIPLLCAIVWGQTAIFAVWNLVPGQFHLEAGYYLPSFICFLFNFAANVLFITAIRTSSLSMTIPMLSFSPVFSILSSFLILGEWPGQRQLLGVLLIVGGALLLGGIHRVIFSKNQAKIDRGAAMMVAVAFFWAVNASLDKMSLRYASSATHSLFQCLGIAVCTSIYLFWREKAVSFAGITRQRGVFILALISASWALFSQLWVIQFVLVGVFEAVKRGTGMMLSQVIGRVFFGEAFTWHKWISVLIMTLGVVLLCI